MDNIKKELKTNINILRGHKTSFTLFDDALNMRPWSMINRRLRYIVEDAVLPIAYHVIRPIYEQ
jgi:hypothetical protein